MLINTTPWLATLEAQQEALRVVKFLIANRHPDRSVVNSGWTVDRSLLEQAAPFAWSPDATAAVLEASRSVPLDTPLKWNLNTMACWWWFERPLPFKTINRDGHGVRALAFGWLKTDGPQPLFIQPPADRPADIQTITGGPVHTQAAAPDALGVREPVTNVDCTCPTCQHVAFPAGTPFSEIENAIIDKEAALRQAHTAIAEKAAEVDALVARARTPISAQTAEQMIELAAQTLTEPVDLARDLGMPCVAWLDGVIVQQQTAGRIQPSQTFEWSPDMTLGEMLEAQRLHYRLVYGPGGIHDRRNDLPTTDGTRQSSTLDEEAYMAATEGLARFILAGLAWVQQKVLITAAAPVERHARKRYAKAIGTPRELQVVQLRRTEYTRGAEADMDVPSDGPSRYTCCYSVIGYWRNQPCGPRHADRRLTWIAPHMSGNRDAPFKPKPAHTVYAVRR